MDEKDDFCPNCKSILNPVEMTPEEAGDEKVTGNAAQRKGLYMRCNECNFSRPTQSFSTIHFTKRLRKGKQSTLNMDPMRVSDLMFDKTYPRTNGLQCVNPSCPSSKSSKNPEVVLLTSDKHPELGYLCTICRHMWGRY